jgi:multiple antibiotic resistance protein
VTGVGRPIDSEGSVPLGAIFPNDFLYEFVTLFVILDPIATLPVFISLTGSLSRRQSLLVAFYALGVSFLVLLFFIVAGQHLLEALKIPMASFQLAGSIVLLLFGLKMVLGKVTEEAADIREGASLLERAIYPLAVPGIAGAGAMLSVVMLTDNNTRSFGEQAVTTAILVLCLLILFVLFALAAAIFRVLGRPGVEIVSRVFGLVLASIAVTNLVIAIKLSFGIALH